MVTVNDRFGSPSLPEALESEEMQTGSPRWPTDPDTSQVSQPRQAFPFPFTVTSPTTVYPPEKNSQAVSVSVSQLAVPTKAQKALRKAWDAVHKGRLDAARTEVTSALTIYPRYADALILSAILYLADRKPDFATAAAEEAVSLDQSNGIGYIVLARMRNIHGEYDAALRMVDYGLRLRPDVWQGYFERACAEFGKSQFASALLDVNRAGELSFQQSPLTHFLRGATLLSLNRQSDGILELQAYLRMNPTGPTADKAHDLIERSRLTP